MNLTHTFTEDKIWVGKNDHNFTVTILPETYICRLKCKRKMKDLYYVWHQRTKHTINRVNYSKLNNVWYLKEDQIQEKENNSATGIWWLIEIAQLNTMGRVKGKAKGGGISTIEHKIKEKSSRGKS